MSDPALIESAAGRSYGAMSTASRTLLVLALLASACSEESAAAPAPAPGPEYAPRLTKELVAPAAKGLVLGVATEKDVTAAFGAGEIVKDKSLGGTAKVLYNEAAAVRITLPAKDDVVKGEAWFAADGGGEPKLQRLELVMKKNDSCKWIETNVGSVDGTTRRPGSNRSYGPGKGGGSYTAGTPDGAKAVGIDCHPSIRDQTAIETLSYAIEGKNGTSSSVQPDA